MLQGIQDWMLMVGVALLVGIDLTIITLYLAVEGGRGNLLAEETSHKENPIKLEGVSSMSWRKCARGIGLGLGQGQGLLYYRYNTGAHDCNSHNLVRKRLCKIP